jgi:hypothetical protein
MFMSEIVVRDNVILPAITDGFLPAITSLTNALGIPREVLASDEEIEFAWKDLPRELKAIPVELRGELVARMCIAVGSGLFDGAMNYIWNAAILQLRQKIRNFGLPIVATILNKDFEEKNLQEQPDASLLDLCLKLNIIDEDGFFFLDQCRSVRNNYSAAHPTMGSINDREFTTFLNRCVRYALGDASSPKGVDISSYISAVKGGRFNKQQCQIWVDRLKNTHDAQRQMLISMVHGMYCDATTNEIARLNSIELCEGMIDRFSNSIKSQLINTHSEYIAKGLEDKHIASLVFFEKLGLLSLLNESEQHLVFSKALDRLWIVHNGMNNFYNEAPFAERLAELSQQGAVPETIQDKFVSTIACCRIGNGYGMATAACNDYNLIFKSFSPREIGTLFKLAADKKTTLGRRLMSSGSCRQNFKLAIALIDPQSVPTTVRKDYDDFML